MINKYINCCNCGKSILFKGGRHKYCSDCLVVINKEKQRLRDWRRVVNKRSSESSKRLCKCPSCGVEFSRLGQGSNRQYCGSAICEYNRVLKNSYKSNRKILDAKKESKLVRLRQYCNDHGIGILFDDFEGDIFDVRGRNRVYSTPYVKYCLSKCGYTLLSDYHSTAAPITVRCPNNHIIDISFGKFIHDDQRCSSCKISYGLAGTTKGEMLINKWLVDTGIPFIYRDKRLLSDYKLELDFYIPSKNVAIEVCGLYWHSEFASNTSHKYHRQKYDYCNFNNVRLITIFYDELDTKPYVVKSRICNALGVVSSKVYARKTICRLVDKKTAKAFLNDYHLQGYSPCKFIVGMYYYSSLIGVMSWGDMSRAHTKVDNLPTLEMKRFAFKPGISVVGGASKLFKHSLRYIKSTYSNVIFLKSFCDMRYANPFKTIYCILGFDLYDETKYTPHYITNHYSKRVRNQGLSKKGVEKISGESEWQLRLKQGYDRIWDCGHRSYIFNIV